MHIIGEVPIAYIIFSSFPLVMVIQANESCYSHMKAVVLVSSSTSPGQGFNHLAQTTYSNYNSIGKLTAEYF